MTTLDVIPEKAGIQNYIDSRLRGNDKKMQKIIRSYRLHIHSSSGFSLLELLLVIAVLAILGGIGAGYYFNVIKNIEMSTTAAGVISDLKHMQSSAMEGESGMRWGVHFVNGVDDYYQIFSTPTNFASASTTIASIIYLPQQIAFSDPADSSTKDIIFERITGVATSTTITLSSPDSTRIITIPAVGSAY